MHLLLTPLLWMGVINLRWGLLFFWNCIHFSPTLLAVLCIWGSSLEDIAWIDERKRWMKEQRRRNVRSSEDFFLSWYDGWSQVDQLTTDEKAVGGLWPAVGLTKFGSHLSQNHLAQRLDVIRFTLLYRCRESKISLINDYRLGQEAILLGRYIQIYL